MDVSDWLYDSVVQFLKSPIWTNPVQSFIDNYCVIFIGEEENKFSHSEVHKEFRNLIETLLENHLADMGITTEQFLECCETGQKKDHFLKIVFEYILAMDDFLTFKKMMEARNKQLEVESLQQLRRELDAQKDEFESKEVEIETPENSVMEKGVDEESKKLEDDEKRLLDYVMRESLKEQEMIKTVQEREDADLKHAIALSLAMQEELYEKVKQKAMEKKVAPNDSKEIRKPDVIEEEAIKKIIQNVKDETSWGDEKEKKDLKKVKEMEPDQMLVPVVEPAPDMVKSVVEEKKKEEKNIAETLKKREVDHDWEELEKKKFELLKSSIHNPQEKEVVGKKKSFQELSLEDKKKMKEKVLKLKRNQLLQKMKLERDEKMKLFIKENTSEPVEEETKKQEESGMSPEEIQRLQMREALKNMMKESIGKKKVPKKKKKKEKKFKLGILRRKKKMGALFSKIKVKDDVEN